ncbi:SRPBCC family protein [bacterium]|nr:SRPBCC family protein [bacterium]
MVHTLEAAVELPRDRASVFEFFADAGNLEQITPPELRFRIITPLPVQIRQGTIINYRLRLYGIPFNWQTRIIHWEPPVKFIDSQIKGPYRSWIHTHRFSETDRGTLMEDRVEYQLPVSPLGELVSTLVKRQVKRIFDYRQATILQILGQAPSSRSLAR